MKIDNILFIFIESMMLLFYIILDLNHLKLKKKITNLIKYKLYDYI